MKTTTKTIPMLESASLPTKFIPSSILANANQESVSAAGYIGPAETSDLWSSVYLPPQTQSCLTDFLV